MNASRSYRLRPNGNRLSTAANNQIRRLPTYSVSIRTIFLKVFNRLFKIMLKHKKHFTAHVSQNRVPYWIGLNDIDETDHYTWKQYGAPSIKVIFQKYSSALPGEMGGNLKFLLFGIQKVEKEVFLGRGFYRKKDSYANNRCWRMTIWIGWIRPIRTTPTASAFRWSVRAASIWDGQMRSATVFKRQNTTFAKSRHVSF